MEEVSWNQSISLDADKVLGESKDASVTSLKRRSDVSEEGIVGISGRLKLINNVLVISKLVLNVRVAFEIRCML